MAHSVLVTGHTGFIGSAVCELLSEHDIAWQGVSLSTGTNLEQPTALDALPPADIVLHLAGRIGVPQSWEDPEGFYRTNFLSTLNALEYARKHGARMVFVSTYMYGAPHYLPIDEAHPVACNNPYTRAKRAAETLCEDYATDYGVQSTMLRIFNTYGPRQSYSSLVQHIVHSAIKSDTITVNDLAPKRDYLWLNDLARAIVTVVEQAPGANSIFNVGYGQSYSVQDVIDTTLSITGPRKVISRDIVRPNEIPDCVCDNSLFSATFNWKPTVSLRDGVANMIETYNER